MSDNTQPAAPAVEETISKKEFQSVGFASAAQSGGLMLAPRNFAEAEKFACFMATSHFVPKHLRSKPGDCLAVLMQSMRWELDPFSCAQKTYFVNDGMGYEAQLVNAIILSRAPLQERPKLEWSGEGENLKCKVSATFKGESTPAEFEAEIKTITTRNSPVWKQQPRQQLGYYALRAWARLYCPDIILGVYTKDELEEVNANIGPDNAVDITPKGGSVLDAFAGTTPHDPATGEIIDNEPAKPETKAEPEIKFEQPIAIPARAMPGDATKTDWDGYTEEFLRLIPLMIDVKSVEKLQKMNERTLGNLEKINPPKHHTIMEAITIRLTDLKTV